LGQLAIALSTENRSRALETGNAFKFNQELNTTLAFIDASPELPQYITRARTAFVRSVRSYAAYRTDQCTLRAAVAGTGNGSEEVRHACEAALDRGRADQLDAAM
jgi:hypothetical protein